MWLGYVSNRRRKKTVFLAVVAVFVGGGTSLGWRGRAGKVGGGGSEDKSEGRYRVCTSPQLGRYVEAATHLSRGQKVLESSPLVSFHKSDASKPLSDTLDEWVKTYRDSEGRAITDRFTIPGWIWAGFAQKYLSLDKEKREQWLNLPHPGKGDPSFEPMMSFAEAILNHLRSKQSVDITVEEMANAMQVLTFNAWQSGERAMLFYEMSLTSHSCSPNLGPPSKLQDTSDIHFFPVDSSIEPGTILSTSHIDQLDGLLMPAEQRRERLFRTKRQWCSCSRCKGEDYVRPMDCPKCAKGTIFHSIEREEKGEPGWQCDLCKAGLSTEEASKSVMGLSTEKMAQHVIDRVTEVEDDIQRGFMYNTSIASTYGLYIQKIIRQDHGSFQRYLKSMGKAMIARGINGVDKKEDGQIDYPKRDRSMGLGFQYLMQHVQWLKMMTKHRPRMLPNRLMVEIAEQWLIPSLDRIESGQVSECNLPKSMLVGIRKEAEEILKTSGK
ncbi:hypothetical protein AAMO2058_000055000 [Amorphochlora amoebiformis]